MATPLPLLNCFADLEDPRIERTKIHSLLDIIALAVIAVIAGADGFEDIARFGNAKQAWLKRYLKLPHGIPSHDTINRVFRMLSPQALNAAWTAWVQALAAALDAPELAKMHVAIDGKTSRRSHDRRRGKFPLQMVSAWCVQHSLVLGQRSVDVDSNEITAIPPLLRMLLLKGAIVSVDAMGCQREIAQEIVKQGADYVMAVKDNQPQLNAAVEEHFSNVEQGQAEEKCVTHRTVEKGHGREVERHYCVTEAPAAVRKAGKGFPKLQSVCEVITITRCQGEETIGVRRFISSLPPKVKQFAQVVRGHWTIENSLHWSLDVTFRDDDSRIRAGHGPDNFAMLRRFALSLIKQDKSPGSVRGKRKQAAWNNDVLATLAGIGG